MEWLSELIAHREWILFRHMLSHTAVRDFKMTLHLRSTFFEYACCLTTALSLLARRHRHVPVPANLRPYQIEHQHEIIHRWHVFVCARPLALGRRKLVPAYIRTF